MTDKVSITNYYLDLRGEKVQIYILLDGIHESYFERIEVAIKPLSFQFTAVNADGIHSLFNVSNLAHEIIPEESFLRIKPDRVVVNLVKQMKLTWASLEESQESQEGEINVVLDTFYKTLPYYHSNDWTAIMGELWKKTDDLMYMSVRILNYAKLPDSMKELHKRIILAEGISHLEVIILECQRLLINQEEWMDPNLVCQVLLHAHRRLNVKIRSNLRNVKEVKIEINNNIEDQLHAILKRYKDRSSKEIKTETANSNNKTKPNEEISEVKPSKSEVKKKPNNEISEVKPSKSEVKMKPNNEISEVKLSKSEVKKKQNNEISKGKPLKSKTSSKAVKKGTPEELLYYLQTSETKFDDDQFEEAIIYFKKAKEISLTGMYLDVQIAHCLILLEREDEAIDIAESMLKKNHRSADGFLINSLNAFYECQKEYAFELIQKSLQIDISHKLAVLIFKEMTDIYLAKDRGNDFFKSNDLLLAIKSYEHGLGVKSKNKKLRAALHQNIGVCHLLELDLEAALKEMNAAIDLNPKYQKAIQKRAEIFMRLDRPHEALQDYEFLCAFVEPDLKYLKPLEKALERTDELKAKQLKVEELTKKGKSLYASQDYKGASKNFSDALELVPKKANLFFGRAACFMMTDQWEKALEDSRQCVTLDPTFVKGFLRKAKIETHFGKFDAAVETFRALQVLDEKSCEFEEGITDIECLKELLKKGDLAVKKERFNVAAQCYFDVYKKAKGASEIFVDMVEFFLLDCQFSQVDSILQALNHDTFEYIWGKTVFFYFNADFRNLDKFVYRYLAPLQPKNNLKGRRMEELLKKIEKLICISEIFVIDARNFENKIAGFRRLIDVDPTNRALTILLLNVFGWYLMLDTKFKEAFVHIEKANKLYWEIKERNSITCVMFQAFRNQRLKCLIFLKRFDEALEDIKKHKRNESGIQLYKIDYEYQLKMIKKYINTRKTMGPNSYYGILNISSYASEEEILDAYRKIYMKTFADNNESMQKKVIEAYNVLSNSIKRDLYDRGEDPNGQRGPSGNELPNFFQSNFDCRTQAGFF